ncbi:MAG: chemotaxis protein, partial [Azovibrio sp.]
AVSQMDEMTQQNAALVEEAAAAAESLEEQARSLAEAVSVFRLQGAAGRQPRPAAPQALAAPVVNPRHGLAHKSGSRKPAYMPAGQVDQWEEF